MFEKKIDFAVIGMACRFPGAENYSQFWENLIQGKNCVVEIPRDRWKWQAFYGDPRTDINKTNIKWGGFIKDIDKFDPLFFNISPKEATYIDPQHRLFLQTAWQCIEDAGYSVESLAGKKIGIYAGVSKNDYSEMMRESRNEIAPFISTGTVHSILTNRLSYLFDFHGRSEPVDTACSSSLVALHNAMRDIGNGECEAALVGGVNALLAPTMFISHSKSGMLSIDGQCKTFDSEANGYVRGEGVGILFIKPLTKAIETGDFIHAVIKGSAINHGGRANFLTSPTVEAQSEVIGTAIETADVDPGTITYVEAHGTGTPLGDPIEINALKKAFKSKQEKFQKTTQKNTAFCALSSVKTNIGHLESASGIAGIIKTILAMQHREIPALRNFKKLNPYIDLEQSPFYIAEKNIKWNTLQYADGETIPRRAGVSSFGMGGVNAHVILEEAPTKKKGGFTADEEKIPQLILISSKKKEGLKDQASNLLHYLSTLSPLDQNANDHFPRLQDIAYTLQVGRDQFSERLALIVSSKQELIRQLTDYIENGVSKSSCFTGSVVIKKGERPSIVKVNNDMELESLAEKWIRSAKLDWAEFYNHKNTASRIPLPVYAFMKKRCWFNHEVLPEVENPDKNLIAVPNQNNDLKMAEIVFNKILRPNAFYIQDHCVQGEKLLPGVAYLEIARAAYDQLVENQRINTIQKVYWINPVIVKNEDLTLFVKLSNNKTRQSEPPFFGNFQILHHKLLHCSGEIGHTDLNTLNVDPINIPIVKQACSREILRQDIYRLFVPYGLNYGPSFQPLQRCFYNNQAIFSELKIPQAIEQTLDDFVLHPSIMDGVFQTIVALSILGLNQKDKQYVPFYLERIEIIKPIPAHCYAYAKKRDNDNPNANEISFDAVICDETGELLVKITGLTKRALQIKSYPDRPQFKPENIHHQISKEKKTDIYYYCSEWQNRDIQRPVEALDQLIIFGQNKQLLQQNARSFSAVKGPVYLVTHGTRYQIIGNNHIQIDPANFDDYLKMIQYFKDEKCAIRNILYLWNFDSDQLSSIDAADNGVISLLHLSKAIISKKAGKNVHLLYCYPAGAKNLRPFHALVAGFARTLIYENPNMHILSLGIDSTNPEEMIQLAVREFTSEQHDKLMEIRYESGKRLARKIVNFTPPDLHLQNSKTVLRKKGVYLITGGAGGLGFIFARYLSEKYSATTILIGRSKLNVQIQEKITAIASLGGECVYYSTDITQADELQRTFMEIKNTYSLIHGVIHAAGIIEDAYILLKKEDSFRRVINTKVKGLLNLDATTRHENLDFVCLFSSIAALMPNQGQSDYASANNFLDSYAALRNTLRDENKRNGFTLAINWPLWAQGGMHVTPEEEAHLLNEFGMAPLVERSGLEIFEQGLKFASSCGHSYDLSHIVAIDGDKTKIAHCLGIENQQYIRSDITGQRETNQKGLQMNDVAKNDIENKVKKIFSELLDIATEKIDGKISMNELGLDSSSMVSIIQHINTLFEINLKPTVFFELDTINEFVQFIDTQCQDKKALTPPPPYNTSLIDVDQSNPSKKQFQRTFNVAEFYLKDHIVENQYNMPGACYIEMARQAGDLLLGDKSVIKLTNNYWVRQLSSPDKNFTAYLNILPKSTGYDYEVISYNDDREKIVHAIGTLVSRDNNPESSTTPDYLDLNAVRARCAAVQQSDQVYQQIIAEGLHVGPTFKPMLQILLSKGEALSTLTLPDSIKDTVDEYVLHPTMLTGIFQTALISNRFNEDNQQVHFIPMGIDEVEIFAPVTSRCLVYSTSIKSNINLKKFDLVVCREDGLVFARLKGFAIRALKNEEKKENKKNYHDEQISGSPDKLSEQIEEAAYHFIKNLLSPHIGLSTEEIDSDESFDAYGINSIMIVELNKSFEDTFGPLSKTLFFEYRNIQELAEYFIENHAEKLNQIVSTNDIALIAGPDSESAETPSIDVVATSHITDQGATKLRESVTLYIKQLLSRHVGLAIDEIEASEDFEAYGINSVMIVELNKAFEEIFGSLSKTLFFEYRNIEELVEYFVENHLKKLQGLFDLSTSANSTKTDQEDNFVRSEIVPVTRARDESSVSKTIKSNITISTQSDKSTELNKDIAIIGIDGRYPQAKNVNEFWEVLKEGTDCITDIPESRFDFRPIFDSDPENHKIYSKRGAFLNDIDKFDAAFFNISPREAELIDPQERLFLEVAWGAMEDAGYTRQALLNSSDRQVGVFVGALWQPYQAIGTEETLKGNIVAPSGLLYSIANRVSYFMNFSGPSLAIDTACSSSLTAVHFACQSLHNKDCKVAIAGGVNLSLHSSKYLFLSQNRFLSTDGRCRSFGNGGDGYVPGEGVGAILLKPLSEAIKDDDAVYAVIKGSSVNHGGKTNGYTVPCPNAQSGIIKNVLKKSGINPRSVSYIEAHGTGTPLGDPIEITGLSKAFEVSTSDKQFCAIGSVKSNIGHLEAAAGIASITKVILQMKNKQLAPSIHSDTLNSNIDFTQTPFRVQRSLSPWIQPELNNGGVSEACPRRAGVSSFGAGGSNAHILLEEFVSRKTETTNEQSGDVSMIVLSAKNEDRLREMATHLMHFLDQNFPTESLSDLAYTLQTGREAMNERLGIAAHSVTALQKALETYLSKENSKNIYTGNITNHKDILNIFGNDEDINSIIESWIAREKYSKLLDIWVKGFNINWNLLYQTQSNKPRRIHLPTYPFAKERYWISTAQVEKMTDKQQDASKLHPLIHKNRSTLSTQRFNSIFSGEEFFLKDHIVGDSKVLPAVAYIEMFWSAAALSIEELKPLKLYNLAWLSPITQKSHQLEVAIELLVENDEFHLRACTEENGKTSLHAQGQCLYIDPSMHHLQLERSSSIQIDEIERSLQNQVYSDQIYALLHNKGLNLQEGFQGINWIKWNGVQALGKITLPDSLNGRERNRYHIHPSLLDSALQTALYILETTHQKKDALFLPYSIEEVEIYATLPDTLYSLVQPSDDKALHESHHSVRSFNVTIVDSSGVILLKIKGFSFKETNLSTGKIQKLSEHAYDVVNPITYSSPAWVETPIDKISSESSVEKATGFIVVSNNAGQLQQFSAKLNQIKNNRPVFEIILSYDNHPYEPGRFYLNNSEQNENHQLGAFLDKVKNDISHIVYLQDSTSQKTSSDISFQTQQSITVLFNIIKHCLSSTKSIRQIFVNICKKEASQRVLEGGINGFFNSLQTEYPKSVNSVISIQPDKTNNTGLSYWADSVISELPGKDNHTSNWIRYSENGQRRYEWQFHPLEDISTPQKSADIDFSAIKAGGTYLITGGMGGIGKILVRYLAQNYNVNLVLIGRSSLDSDNGTFIKSIRYSTGNAIYLQADITDSDELEQAVTKAKQQYGAIHGVIHCAGVLEDNLLINGNIESLKKVLRPKLQGTINLDQATSSEPLDFFLVFSSLTSVLGNPGQCNYGAANGFMDAFIAYRETLVQKQLRQGLSLTVNWPFWKDGKMGQNNGISEMLADLFGKPLTTAEGIKCFEQILHLGRNQVAVVKNETAIASSLITQKIQFHENNWLCCN